MSRPLCAVSHLILIVTLCVGTAITRAILWKKKLRTRKVKKLTKHTKLSKWQRQVLESREMGDVGKLIAFQAGEIEEKEAINEGHKFRGT